MIPPATLVRVDHEIFNDALGIVLEQNGGDILVRLGNGLLIVAIEANLEVVEFMPGSGTPCAFHEDVAATARAVNWQRKLGSARRSD
jgi:hypothetical protein